MNKKNIKISCLLIVFIFLFSTFYFLFVANKVLADDQSVTTIDFKPNYPWEGEKSPAGLVARFYQIALGLAGAAALAVLIYGAILWTVSGAVTSKQDAMQWISAAIWGLALLLAAYLILYTINPDLVNLGSGEKLFQPIQQAAQQETTEQQQAQTGQRIQPLPANWESMSFSDQNKWLLDHHMSRWDIKKAKNLK